MRDIYIYIYIYYMYTLIDTDTKVIRLALQGRKIQTQTFVCQVSRCNHCNHRPALHFHDAILGLRRWNMERSCHRDANCSTPMT